VARWKYWTQKGLKNRHLGTIVQLFRTESSQLRHLSTIAKKALNSNISSTCAHNMANFGPLAAEIGSAIWGTPALISTAFASWQRYFTPLWRWVSAKLCGVEQRAYIWQGGHHVGHWPTF